MRTQAIGKFATLAFVAALLATNARASYHTFVIDEVFTAADGGVQYVVLREAQNSNGENLLAGRQLVAKHGTDSRSFTFPANLPSSATAGKRVLIGSASYAALGLAAPDYIVPDRFVPTDGGSLNYADADTLALPALPTDGTLAFFRGGTTGPNVATNFAGASASVPLAPVTVVEFYNPAFDHYFVSPLAPDIDALDSGRFAGWQRTGQTFKALPAPAAGLNPVCRFYIPPQHGNSHFFSASPAECTKIANLIPVDPNYSGYSYETPNAFYIALPDTGTGACAGPTQPVYRLWNQRADSNHRYTTSTTIKAQMLAQGYVAEGYGPDAVAMCAPATVIAEPAVRVTQASPYAPNCDGTPPTGAFYAGAEVEPMLAADPRDAKHLIGVWQQDRWSDGGSAGLATGVSFDGGKSWQRRGVPFTRCAGGNAGNGGNYARASDPWVTIAPDGAAYQIAIAFNGADFAPGSNNAVLVSRSGDGGLSWSNPLALIEDGASGFNDKESITADGTDARHVYAVWDRLTQNNGGPTWFARTTDAGASWEAARTIYNPGKSSQTINNQIVVLPDGALVLFCTQLDPVGNNEVSARLIALRSPDKGATWSEPVVIDEVQTVGTQDPDAKIDVRSGSTLGAIAAGRNGTLAAVWQDSRFSQGRIDSVVLSRSLDGGRSWSVPVRVNAAAGAAAFVPAVAVRDDGVIGVTYYDFRNNTPATDSLPTDYWFTASVDGKSWQERHLAGPFDLQQAPFARGLFLGDYQALVAAGTTFIPFYAAANGGDANNRTDIFAASITGATAAAKAGAGSRTHVADAAAALPVTPELRARISANIVRTMRVRLPAWQPPSA